MLEHDTSSRLIESCRTGQFVIAARSTRSFILTGLLLSLVPNQAAAWRPFEIKRAFYQQGSAIAAAAGKLNVPASLMAGHCITMVTPIYPQTNLNPPIPATIVVRVVIWKTGRVSPISVVSGQPSFENAAMNAVRLWQYRPFTRDGDPVDVTTDIHVDFVPVRPGGIVSHPTN